MENLDKFSKSIHNLSVALGAANVTALEATAHADADFAVRPALELIQKKLELISGELRDKQKVVENITKHELREIKCAVDAMAYEITDGEGGFIRFIEHFIAASRPFVCMKSLPGN